ncbi:MAG: DNA mismatch repair protein MutS [Dehalococcoidales bacterium]|nr:DNA mismatch repair protein MutS [Dehalococcoidales bacterium]
MTPIRQQYLALKRKYPDAILLFRLGDFYEAFDDDAKAVSSELEIVLTSREMGKGQRVPLAGIPYHSLEGHLTKLVNRGYKVAICEQVSDPATSRGIVDREVVRVVTPGTVVEPSMLDARSNNYLASVLADGDRAGVAYADITTGEFYTTQLAGSDIAGLVREELARLSPAECLVPRDNPRRPFSLIDLSLATSSSTHVTPYDALRFDLEACREALQDHFGVTSLEGFGCAGLPLAIRAAGALLQYLGETQKASLAQLDRLRTYSTGSYMILDAATRYSLELTRTSRLGTTKGSLLWVLDKARTPMGGRLLRKWIAQPLLDINRLDARQRAVAWFVGDTAMRAKVVDLLNKVGDLERLINRVSQGVASPRELVGLRSSLEAVPLIRQVLSQGSNLEQGAGDSRGGFRHARLGLGADNGNSGAADAGRERPKDVSSIAWLVDQIDPCEEVVSLIGQSISPDPPNSLADGGVIRPGFSDELDNLHAGSKDARQWVARLEGQERERTGIRSLKVGYNRVFGYYIEVTNPNLDQPVGNGILRQTPGLEPTHSCGCKINREHLERCHGYIRKQTLVGAERFITPELKEQEALILGAQERIVELETRIFRQVCQQVADSRQMVLKVAKTLAHCDVFCALAEVAVQNGYVCPKITDGDEIKIVAGRHPVVELTLSDAQFVANDVCLSNSDAQLIILTGPNMAGKSTYGLMVGLIVLMAQIGSFVPAESATIGLVDRVFTRVGAQHDITAGQSTFLVEMAEAANILNNATPRSLVILDEIGRGTSTYDGMAIARAIVEHIHNHPRLGCKTLFATHYHELTELEEILPRVKNCRVDVLEEGGGVVFLHKVVSGGADRSYGIHVAKLAGIPKAVIRRAEEVLKELEAGSTRRDEVSKTEAGVGSLQLTMFGEPDPALEELKSLDVLSMTPLEAITKLFELQKKARAKESSER